MLANTELLKETSGFTWSTHFFKTASNIVWNAFTLRQEPALIGAHTSQHDLDRETVTNEQDSRTSCDAVSKAMEKLPSAHREILVMVCIEGMRYAEAAEKLGIEIDAVYARLSCARQELQNLLAQGS